MKAVRPSGGGREWRFASIFGLHATLITPEAAPLAEDIEPTTSGRVIVVSFDPKWYFILWYGSLEFGSKAHGLRRFDVIIRLVGSDSRMKSKLSEYLAGKSFYVASASDLAELEQDKNYVIVVSHSDGEAEFLKQNNSMLVWVGGEIPNQPQCDLVLDSSESEDRVQEKLDQVVLRGLSQQARPNWDEYFMKIAQVASMRSNCIKRKVGAVIVRDKRIVSTGYNGTPRGTKNCNEGGCPRCNSLASSGTRLDECLCSHAEENSITQAAYHGTSVKEGTLYTTFAPCLMCTKMIINSGIVEVVFNFDYPLNDTSFNLFKQAGVVVRQYRLK